MAAQRPPIRNVPAPQGSKAGTAYTRFIPREELQDFAAWNPDALGPAAASHGVSAAAPEPAPAELPAQLKAARDAGYHDGYRDGLVALEGFKQGFAAQATAQVGQLLVSMEQAFLDLEDQIAQGVAQTAVQLARQLLRSELAARPDAVTRIAAEAVNAVMLSARQLTLHLHPDDLPLVAEGAADLLAARSVRLVPDEGIDRGGCRIESSLGSVDATLARRWAQAAGTVTAPPAWNDDVGADDARDPPHP